MDRKDDRYLELLERTAKIVSAYVSNNSIEASGLPSVIASVHDALSRSVKGEKEQPADEIPIPAVPVKKSVTDDFIICLEDGLKFKSLKRHLTSKFGMSPNEYRKRWRLPSDYPMVAPLYSAKRSAMALSIGLGRNASAAASSDAPVKRKRGRPPKTAITD